MKEAKPLPSEFSFASNKMPVRGWNVSEVEVTNAGIARMHGRIAVFNEKCEGCIGIAMVRSKLNLWYIDGHIDGPPGK